MDYIELCKYVLENGVFKEDRTSTGTISVFDYTIRHDLSKGAPFLTTKRIHLKSVIHELLWFLSGNTNIAYLKEHGVRIWDEWADENGELGPVYGSQWREWQVADIQYDEDLDMKVLTDETIDQISNIIQLIKTNPDSRRHLVSAWNVGEIRDMKLPPCHFAFQFYVAYGKLSCKFNMRSTDVFLGLPFNLACYGLLTMMVAQVCDLEVGDLIYSGGDVHIYTNHIEQIKTQISREPKELPRVKLNPNVEDIFGFTYDDFIVEDYNPHPAIKGKVSV
ncbi:thymidylate synthase [Paenibacillus xylanexedens]|uniref:thymidylate synthase n=1 Tax=Paenibacillus xylanexedens TaxID=528191 RepID=UPI000F54A90E|nr:thymidylate synthase [Paenibacillus xylanexedens]